MEFKTQFDPSDRRQLCEVLKDIFALSNSGGGVVVVGVDDLGQPNGLSVESLLRTDPADLANKIAAYSGRHYDDVTVRVHLKAGMTIATIEVGPTPTPLIPVRPGTYEKEPGKQATAFSVGVVYVRHGAKSEPATSNDLERIFEKRLREVRASWLSGLRKVVAAPPGSVVSVTSRSIGVTDNSGVLPVRITTDPDTQVVGLADPDKANPFRLHDMIPRLNQHLKPLGIKATDYDIRAVRAVYQMDQNESYTWKPQYGSRKYSEAFVEWLMALVREDKYFFKKVRSKWKRMRAKK